MFNMQSGYIQRKTTEALKSFQKTYSKLQKIVDQAEVFVSQNAESIKEHKLEIEVLETETLLISKQVEQIKLQQREIDKIINPGMIQ